MAERGCRIWRVQPFCERPNGLARKPLSRKNVQFRSLLYGFPKLSARGYLRSSVSPYVYLQSAVTRVNCWMACKLTSSKVDGEIQQVFVVQLTPLLPPTESISGRSRSKCANTQRPSTSPARLARGDSALIFLLRRPQHEPTSFLNRPCSCQVHEQLSPTAPWGGRGSERRPGNQI